jgi:hypothetical protein
MVGQGGDQNAQGYRQGLPKTGGQYQRQKLGFVTDFGQGNQPCGNEQGFHLCILAVRGLLPGSGRTILVQILAALPGRQNKPGGCEDRRGLNSEKPLYLSPAGKHRLLFITLFLEGHA